MKWLPVSEMNEDSVFRALADASRRRLLDRLHARNGQTLHELCRGLRMTRQAVSKHLTILNEAHLVSWKREGREKLHFINPVPLNEIAERWISNRSYAAVMILPSWDEAMEASTVDWSPRMTVRCRRRLTSPTVSDGARRSCWSTTKARRTSAT